ncbi:hypothetical protein DSAG12_02131 [Promethearchaeum syntrophicum]|uniref:Uncharacterized protein n=1 Tax=Promethearchaeum syntrophicum TaxID=2594042 RepID=A0A5B9DBB8_9ARCH|nr:hypothetical protein [Candidatus Prometheoarchaeum syntrophicum]QEE16301.1 hypothetical protein DSAG12_02131 [Candidatus Prometheoarchaeum syntrophicum]
MTKKKIGRNQEAEIKKQLRTFAKKEFTEKKPLEIRVLQLKPGVVFKKGSMFPNLMIKSLTGAAYVIYLDYGDSLKFYYFLKNGKSAGGSNFEKSEKLLKEMHGKATTLLKLPKIIKIIGLESENKKIRERWERLAKKYSHKLGIKIKSLPAISVKKKFSTASIRIGIEKDKDILHFDYDYYLSDLQDTVLLRELFPILINSDANKETLQMISTIWALTYKNSKQYRQILKAIIPKKRINKEARKWIETVFLPYIETNSEKKEIFGSFLAIITTIINQSNMFDLLLLWLINFGITKYRHFFKPYGGILHKSWLFYELLEFLYTESSLCRKFGIIPHNDHYLFLIHLCNQYILKKDSKIKEFSFNCHIPYFYEIKSAFEHLRYKKLREFIPMPMFSKNKGFLGDMVVYLLSSEGIRVEGSMFINLSRNSEKEIDFSIKNMTDLILNNVEFHLDFTPLTKIAFHKIDPPRVLKFEGDMKLKINIKSTDKAGTCTVRLKMSFEDPFSQRKIKNQIISIIQCRVTP